MKNLIFICCLVVTTYAGAQRNANEKAIILEISKSEVYGLQPKFTNEFIASDLEKLSSCYADTIAFNTKRYTRVLSKTNGKKLTKYVSLPVDAGNYISISYPVLADNGKYAVVQVSFTTGFSGNKSMLLLEKQGETWRICNKKILAGYRGM